MSHSSVGLLRSGVRCLFAMVAGCCSRGGVRGFGIRAICVISRRWGGRTLGQIGELRSNWLLIDDYIINKTHRVLQMFTEFTYMGYYSKEQEGKVRNENIHDS
jgi:hypothetical protein